jgi:hypothetical protein
MLRNLSENSALRSYISIAGLISVSGISYLVLYISCLHSFRESSSPLFSSLSSIKRLKLAPIYMISIRYILEDFFQLYTIQNHLALPLKTSINLLYNFLLIHIPKLTPNFFQPFHKLIKPLQLSPNLSLHNFLYLLGCLAQLLAIPLNPS